jgi:hypothetical protein
MGIIGASRLRGGEKDLVKGDLPGGEEEVEDVGLWGGLGNGTLRWLAFLAFLALPDFKGI